MKPIPNIECDKCSGTGLMPIPNELLDILSLADKRMFVTASCAQSILDPEKHIVKTAWNNRLKRMFRIGYMHRTKRGREWAYVLSKTGRNILTK